MHVGGGIMNRAQQWNHALELAMSGRGRLTRGDAKGKFFVGHVIDHCNPPNARKVKEPWTCDCDRVWVTVNVPNQHTGEPATWMPKDSLPEGWVAAYFPEELKS